MAQTPYETIVHYNHLLEEEISNGVPFSLSNFPSSIFIDKDELTRLLEETENGLMAVFGIEDADEENKKFTVSFLAVDSERKLLCKHIKGQLDGEETWPASATYNFPTTIDSFDPGDC